MVGGELWAKWWPYSHKLVNVAGSHLYPGSSILSAAGPAGTAPSWSHAWHFTVVYGKSVWIALVAALLIGAGVQALVPRQALGTAFGRTGATGSVLGAVTAVPCMMCTCCSAPITLSLRRAGASTASALAYWLGNPLLNPAVLAFLALVLPWRYTAVRLVVGTVVVVAVSPVIARLASPDRNPEPVAIPETPPRTALVRYIRSLLRLAVVLVPEYFVVVLAVGAFRGWLLPLGHAAATAGFWAVIVAAAAGTLLVIPTGAEIPVIVGLTAAGFGAGVTGAVLIALPAVSLPSMIMVGRALSGRVIAASAGAVVIASLAAAALLAALS